MMHKPASKNSTKQSAFSHAVGVKAARKLKARHDPAKGVWFGLGMMGIIGWSVVIPALVGAVFGIWLDSGHPGSYSWTLILLLSGLCLGCLIAWHWVSRQNKEMQKKKEDKDE